MRILCVLILIAVIRQSLQKSTAAEDHYVAAVVEFHISTDNEDNVDRYVRLIEEAATQNADIIVFPELTLTTSFAVPIHGLLQQYPIPAHHSELYDSVLVSISAAARNNSIYVVINSRERVDCIRPREDEECPEQKVYLFNTNIVFDRTGAVIDRYRKINLFGEINHTPALKPDLGIFTTDFGVTFGHFICMDLLYQVPAIQVIQKHNIKDIIFPTMWFSQQPYLTAVQIQEAYAYTMDVNFLAAGANRIESRNAGSGIYSGKAGPLISLMPAFNTTKLLVAKVPKTPGKVIGDYPGHIFESPKDYDNLVLRTDGTIRNHDSVLLHPGYHSFSLGDGDICHFSVNMTLRSNTKYQYRAVAYHGPRTFGGRPSGGVQSCAIISCTDNTLASCGVRFTAYEDNSTAVFEELTIIGLFPEPLTDPDLQADDSVVFPLSLTTSFAPLGVNDFSYKSENIEHSTNISEPMETSNFVWKRHGIYSHIREIESDKVVALYAKHKMSLKNLSAELYTFGLWGRLFNFQD